MKHAFLVFPGGSTGAALLLLRLAVSVALLAPTVGSVPLHPSIAIASYLLAFVVGIGLYTRVVALVSVTLPIAVAIAAAGLPSAALISFSLQAVAVALVGPGAISIDALLFGRRTVYLRH